MAYPSQYITLDIGLNKAEPIHFVQGEQGRLIGFNAINSLLVDGDDQPLDVDPTDFDEIRIHILKPDGNFIDDVCVVDDGVILYELDEQCCIAGGVGKYDISFIDGEDVVIYTAHGDYMGDFRAIEDSDINSVSIAQGIPFPDGFQEKLIAGTNITIVDNVISSTGGGGGGVGDITATASVDASTGTPSVVVTKTTSGDDANFDFAFHNLKGIQGDPGTPGADGADGADGVGVPAGGTAGQVLAKINSTDYNTTWITPSGGGGGGVGQVDTLYTGSAYAATITLIHDMFDYDNLIMEIADSNGYTRGSSFAPSELSTSQVIGLDNSYGYIWYSITSGTSLTAVSNNNYFIASIVGVKYGAATAATVSYDNTVSGLTATDVQDAIDEVQGEVSTLNSKIAQTDGVSVNLSSAKTLQTSLNELFSLVDQTKIKYSSKFIYNYGGGSYSALSLMYAATNTFEFSQAETSSSGVRALVAYIRNAGSGMYQNIGTTYNDLTNTYGVNGRSFEIYY